MNNKHLILCICIAVLSIPSCTTVNSIDVVTPNEEESSATPTIPTITTTSPIPTQTPSPEPEVEPFQYPTPLPLLADIEARRIALEFVETNGGCELPCWWSIIPGESTVEEANKILSPLISSSGITNYEGDEMFVSYALPPNEAGQDRFGRAALEIANGTVITIYASPNLNVSMPIVLREYGPATEVWLLAREVSRDTWSMRLDLFYEDQGFLLNYSERISLDDEAINKNTITGCFHNVGRMFLWWPELKYSYNDANIDPVPGVESRLLEEVSALDVDKLHESTIDENKAVCVETPKVIWLE